MALQLHSPFLLSTDQPYRHLPNHHISSTKLRFSIRSQDPSPEPANKPTPTKKPSPAAAAGQGFGPPPPPSGGGAVGKVEEEEQGENERAFVLTWLGLGGVILVQGILLSASDFDFQSAGFLPEEWDRFFVKYLFPIFTPTVGLFLAGTVAYGVLKYLQNEKLKDQK
ncbi:Protein LPA2 [Linum perenne]